MRHFPRFLGVILATGLVFGPGVRPASATSIEDLIKLKANKTTPVSDDVLVALIESDGSVFHLTADDIPALRQKGLSERVIIAMLLTAKNARPADVVEPPAADVNQTGQADYLYREPGTPLAPQPPVVVNVTQQVTQTVESPRRETRTAYVPVYVPVAVPVVRQPPPAPVYWGYGGQLRPDAWRPANDPPKPAPDAKPDVKADPKKVGGGQ